jgi:hypothetical protein
MHLRALAYLLAARAALSLFGLKRLVRMKPRQLRGDADRAMNLARALDSVARRVPSTCLQRALALVWLLRASGLAAVLRIGVRPGAGSLAAHAWVEHEGVVLLDEDASRFVPFDAPILVSE